MPEEADKTPKIVPTPIKMPTAPQPELKVNYYGRNILDLGGNLKNSTNLRYAELPSNNLQFFFNNRSQYHRLGAGGPRPEFTMDNCKCCRFDYPNIPANAPTATASANLAAPQNPSNPVTFSLTNFLKSFANEYNGPTPITKKNMMTSPNYNNNAYQNNNTTNYGNYYQKMAANSATIGLSVGSGNQSYNNGGAGKQNYYGGGVNNNSNINNNNNNSSSNNNNMSQNALANLLHLVNMRPNSNANNANTMRCYNGNNNGVQGHYGLYNQF